MVGLVIHIETVLFRNLLPLVKTRIYLRLLLRNIERRGSPARLVDEPLLHVLRLVGLVRQYSRLILLLFYLCCRKIIQARVNRNRWRPLGLPQIHKTVVLLLRLLLRCLVRGHLLLLQQLLLLLKLLDLLIYRLLLDGLRYLLFAEMILQQIRFLIIKTTRIRGAVTLVNRRIYLPSQKFVF